MLMDSQNQSLTFPFDVSGAGADRLRLAVKHKLKEFLEIYTDDVLVEYVIVLVGHGKQQAQATADLEAFLGDQTEPFVAWLWDHLTANQQLFLTNSLSVDALDPAARGEKQLSQKPPEVVRRTSNFLGMEASEVQNHSKVSSRNACSTVANTLKFSPRASQKDKGKERKEKDSCGDELACSELKSSEIRTGHSQLKRRRFPEPWSRRPRNCINEEEQSKRETISLQVRATRRLLESAVRDAVAPTGNGPKKNAFKRLHSIVKKENDHAASALESSQTHHASRSRTTVFKHGGKISPAVIVALKAAAAAAEDVNSYSKKSRVKIINHVSHCSGSRNSGLPKVREEAFEVIGRNEHSDNVEQVLPIEEVSEVEEGMISDRPIDSPVNDRHEWTSWGKSSSNTYEEDALLLDDDVAPSDAETMPFDEVRSSSPETLPGGGEAFEWQAGPVVVGHCHTESLGLYLHVRGVHNDTDIEVPRQDGQSDIVEKQAQRIQEEATTSPYTLIQNFDQAEVNDQQQNVPLSFGRVISSQKSVSLNANMSTFKTANKLPVAQADADGQKETRLLNMDNIEPPEINVLEMRKRMRQVELEMTKLRARQAEVTKEVQKVTATPASAPASAPPVVKPSPQLSEEDVDSRSIFVTNVHFAATRDVISSHFANCGEILRVTMLTDGATGMPKGSAYVEFSSRDGVEKALKLNESNLLSRPLKVVRKEVAFPETSPVIRPALLHPLHLAVRPVVQGTFFRRPPILMRSSRLVRPFLGGQRLQWKRATCGPHGYPAAPYYDGPSGSSLVPPVNGYRSLGGPIRNKRSLSYVRSSTGTCCETSANIEEQKAG